MKKESGEKFNPRLLSHLHTADQSERETVVNVGLALSESYRNGWAQVCLFMGFADNK